MAAGWANNGVAMNDKVKDVVHEAGNYWVFQDKTNTKYTVFAYGITHSTSDSSYPMTPDGLSIATARANYLALHHQKAYLSRA
jgi:hypothetical protein